ncbi:hypothetical protein JNM87_04340 [Candidatus Saccharibacteria bacterium]|nr:hypothetical protein [Candidatus Saccharibacteria bacterium]
MTVISTRLADAESGSRMGAEMYRLGDVASVAAVKPIELGLVNGSVPRAIYRLGIVDPYVAKYDDADRARYSDIEAGFDSMARAREVSGRWKREPGTVYFDAHGNPAEKGNKQWGDPESNERFLRLAGPGLKAWSELIPSAKALMCISDPEAVVNVATLSGSTEMDEEGRKWLTLSTDGRGIRSRGTTMAEIVRGYAEQRQFDGQVNWMSVACGTALPAMQGAMRAGIDNRTSLTLVDLDPDAMGSTQSLATDLRFQGDITQQRMNIFDPRKVQNLKERFEQSGQRIDLIDAVGILEYTSKELLGVDTAVFLRSYYDLLAPGGKLVAGQMRADRPNPHFTMGVIGWPYVVMRTPAELMKVVTDAGIPAENVTMYLPDDGVYSVISIDKPWEGQPVEPPVELSKSLGGIVLGK